MTARGWLRAAALGLAAAAWLLSPAARADGGSAAADLRAGRPFVAVVVDSGSRALLASEAYADWHGYFADFIAGGRGALPVYTLRPAAAGTQLPRLRQQLRRGLRNGTLFVAANGRALLHDGLVLEPQVYAIGRSYADGGSAGPDAAAYGLKPIDLAPARGRAASAR